MGRTSLSKHEMAKQQNFREVTHGWWLLCLDVIRGDTTKSKNIIWGFKVVGEIPYRKP